MWTHRRQAAGKTPLLALEVIDSPQERAAVYAMFAVVALEAALNFSVPLYIQIVQGRSPLATAVAMMPFNLTVFFTAMLIVRFYDRLTPRQIGRYGFMLCTVALLWLAFVVRNDWSAVPVLFGLVLFGIGQGALVTLLFNVLVTASPKELAGDVGSLRGTTQQSRRRGRNGGRGRAACRPVEREPSSAASPQTPCCRPSFRRRSISTASTSSATTGCRACMAGTTATPAQVAEAVRVNTEARLRALKIGLLHHGRRCAAGDHPGRTICRTMFREKCRATRAATQATRPLMEPNMSMSVEAAAGVMREAMRDAVKRHSLWYLVQSGLMNSCRRACTDISCSVIGGSRGFSWMAADLGRPSARN